MADNRLNRKKAKLKTRTKLIVPKKTLTDKGKLRRRLRIVRQVFFVVLLMGLSGIFLYNNRDYILSAAEEFNIAAALPKPDEGAVMEKAERRAEADSLKAARRAGIDSAKAAKRLEAAAAKSVKRAMADSLKVVKGMEAERVKVEKKGSAAEAKSAKKAAADSIKTAKKVAADSIKSAKKVAADSAKTAKKAAGDNIKIAKKSVSDSIKTAKKNNAERVKAEKYAKRDKDVKTVGEVLGEREFADTGSAKRGSIPKESVIELAKTGPVPKRSGEDAAKQVSAPRQSDVAAPELSVVKTTAPARVSEPSVIKTAPERALPPVAKTAAPVKAAAPIAVRREPAPAAPKPEEPKFTPVSIASSAESFVLTNIKCRLADRTDIGISVTAELFFEGGALRREITFKRGTLEALTASVVRRHESGDVRPAALSADLLAAYNGALESGRLNRVDVKDLRVEGAAP